MASSVRQRPVRRRAVLPFVLLGPPVAWLLALGSSYLGQDFACSAADSAGAPPPGTGLIAAVIVIDLVLLLVTLAAGALGLLLHRRSMQPDERPDDEQPDDEQPDDERPDDEQPDGTAGFVGVTGVALAVLFSFGIVLIAVNPTVLAAC